VTISFRDTAGQERFHTLSTSYFRGAQGFVLVYDITNLKSFQSITIWMNDIYEKAGDEVDVILLGNKCDKESERVVPKQKGEKVSLVLSLGPPEFLSIKLFNRCVLVILMKCLLLFVFQKSCVLHDLDVVSLNETKKRTCCAF
ncbi:RAB10 protein, partial [Chloropsis cyanopogon]|nr:RAB10 protein [Chloropsis cyanopogon]